MVGRVFDTAIVQVEAVNVDICFHKPLNTETAVRRSRTRFAEATTGGYASIIARNSETVKQTFFLFYLNCSGERLCLYFLENTSIHRQRLGQIPRKIRVEPPSQLPPRGGVIAPQTNLCFGKLTEHLDNCFSNLGQLFWL